VNTRAVQDVFVNLGGQDDNLGDSVLRAGYFLASRGEGRRYHVLLEERSSDYVTALPLEPTDIVYTRRSAWAAAGMASQRPVQLFEAGEINPRARPYPKRDRVEHLHHAADVGGVVIMAGMGLKHPAASDFEQFDPVLREAAVVSWRDAGSRDAVGFGGVAPDWAFSLGTHTSEWSPASDRPLLAVTLRFDRPWPDERWLSGVREIATQTGTRIVTVAQVARDAPRAVRLAEALGGEYLIAPSTSHADLDAHVRAVYSRSLAVVSDRAHGLIIAATEGAYPIGSAADPQKISRILAAAGLGDLVGHYDEVAAFGSRLEASLPTFVAAMDAARADVAELTERMQTAMAAA
jgi:hypothetical protein